MALLLIRKANPNHDHRGRFARAPEGKGGGSSQGAPAASADITTEAQARAYWQAHFAGRTFTVGMEVGKGRYEVHVAFPADNLHAWTRKAEPGDPVAGYDRPMTRQMPRTFDGHRALAMDQLLPMLNGPWKVVGAGDRDVVVAYASAPGGGAYTATFAITKPGHYELVSAYPRSREQILALIRAMRARPPAGLPANTLRKGGGPSALHSDGPLAGHTLAVPSGHTGLPRPLAIQFEDWFPFAATAYLSAFCDLFKAASIPPSARWITVRPNGPGTEGQPVLIQPTPDGGHRVIGGAGGKLNYLKLTGVRSEKELATAARDRATAAREKARRQREMDQATGSATSKKEAREIVRAQVGDARAKFLATAAAALGWTEADTRFPEEKFQNATPEARDAAEKAHQRGIEERARKAVDAIRQRVLEDANTRAAAGLDTVPMTPARPEDISVRDLDPAPEAVTGLGFAAKYTERAEAAGLTPEARREEAAEITGKEPPAPRPKPADMGKRIREAMDVVRAHLPAADPAKVAPDQIIAMVKAEKALRMAKAEAGRSRACRLWNRCDVIMSRA